MKPSPPASKEALIRRATYDLIGLPPTPEEVAAFVSDTSPDAFEKVVDRLLASPALRRALGPLLARHRPLQRHDRRATDTQGRLPLPLRLDVPRLRHQQLQRRQAVRPVPQGADRRRPAARSRRTTRRASPRSGFITVGKRFQNPNDTIDERIDTLTKATMGLTVACARCHDHKFDPIPTADYYSLHGIFASTIEPSEKPLIGDDARPAPEYDEFQQASSPSSRAEEPRASTST